MERAAEIGNRLGCAWRLHVNDAGSFLVSSEQGAVAAEAARVLCIGGGAYYFAASLKPFIPALSVPARPELANAQGYLAIGSQLSERAWARLKP